MQDVTLNTLCGGAAQELFAMEQQRVAENIMDPNTDPEAPREITLKIKFKPSPSRDYADVSLTVASKLAAAAGRKGPVFIGEAGGHAVVRQQDIAQQELGFTPPGQEQ